MKKSQKVTPKLSSASGVLPPVSPRPGWQIVLAIGCLILFVLLLIILLPKNDAKTSTDALYSVSDNPPSTVTPILFSDMTIPYLRNKEYKSTLGELTKNYDGSNYTAYTTSYKSEGLKINALLTKPAGEQPKNGWPAIVFVHGYIPPDSYATVGPAYSAYVDYLANNGFVVFKIDLRGHGESEGEPGGAYYSSDYVIDTLNAYAALQATPFIDGEHIGMWGHSMAGNILMRSVAAKPSIPAVVIWGGAGFSYEDMLKYRINDLSYRPQQNSQGRQRKRQEMYVHYGSPSAKSAFWKQVMPVSYLNDLRGAIELHHAVDDTVVDVGYSRDLNALLDKTSVEHSFFEYPSGGHNISSPSFEIAMQRTVSFFHKYLQ